MTVTGSPGVGKSVWLLYLMWVLAREEKTVVFQHDAGTRYLLTPGRALRGDGVAFYDELSNMEAYDLVDGRTPSYASARTILSCPPDNSIPRASASEKIMPRWAPEELEQARELLVNVTKQRRAAPFIGWGPTIYVSWYGARIAEVEEVSVSDLLRAVDLARNPTACPIARFVVAMIPNAELNSSHYDVASERIAEAVVRWSLARGRAGGELQVLPGNDRLVPLIRRHTCERAARLRAPGVHGWSRCGV